MALIAVSTMSYSTFAVPALVAASTSDTFAMPTGPGQMFAVYRNSNAATRTLTVDIPAGYTDVFGRAGVDIGPVTLAATTGELWIPLHPAMADTTGTITILNSVAANVTVACVRIA
jgi:hypothetical protein